MSMYVYKSSNTGGDKQRQQLGTLPTTGQIDTPLQDGSQLRIPYFSGDTFKGCYELDHNKTKN